MSINIQKEELLKKYNIDLREIIRNKISEEDGKNIVCGLLYAYELAEKNSLKGSLTNSSYACGIVLDDNSIHYGVNFNGTRNEISSICAERMAMLNAFNSKVEEYDPKKGPFGYKINYILMTRYTEKGVFWTNKITPCADCLSWFNTGENLSLDAKIVSLKKDENEKIFLDIQPLKNFLPLRNLSYEIIEAPETKQIIKSENAKLSTVKDEEIIKLYKNTYQTFKNNNFSKTSNQNIAAGVISNGEMFFGAKIDYSKRWFTEPLEVAAAKAVEKFGENTKIDAVCYVGEEYTITESGKKAKDGLISLRTLGRLNTRFTDNFTLVVTGDKTGINIRTIGDYMPTEHRFIQDYEIK